MAAIASVFIECLPETSKVADGIRRAFREADPIAAEAGRRWGTEIERGIGTVKVEVDADTTKAAAQIDAMSRDRKATVEVDADTAGASIQRAVSSGISQGGEAGVSAMQPALLGVGITMAAGIASALSGLAGLLPAGLLGAGSVVGTLAVGLDGVKEAWDTAGKAADTSGKAQETQAKAVVSAQKSLKSAVQDEEHAQKDVAQARKDALQQLRDLNLELSGGALDEKGAILDAQAARRDLATGRFKDAIEYEQAQLRVQQADQRVAEVQQRNADLQTKAADANAKGVEGADKVVAANERVANAHDRIIDSQDRLSAAQTQTSSQQDAAAAAFAKLAPNAQVFLDVLHQLKPAWDQLGDSVQNTLFAGVGEQLQALATQYLPLLQGAMGGIAGTLNQAFGGLSQFLQQPQTMAAMQTIFANIGQSFQIWSQSIQPFAQAFLRITEVGSGFLPQLAQMVVQVANAFNQWAQSGQLGEWIQTGMTALQQLGGIIQTLLPMFGQLAPIGTATLGALQTVLTALQPAIAPLAGTFAALITEIAPSLGIIGQLISQLIIGLAPAFTQLFIAMAPVAQQIAGILGPVLSQLGPVLAQISTQVGLQLAAAIQQLLPQLIPMVQQMAKLLEDLIPLLPQLATFSAQSLPAITAALQLMMPWTTQMMTFIDTLVTKVPGLISPLLGLADAFEKIGNSGDKLQWLTGPLGKLLSMLPGGVDNPATPGLTPPPSAGGFNWDAVAQAESSGNWQNRDTGNNGHFGGLQFSPETWLAYGGGQFTQNPADATREQQIEIANRTAFTGFNGQPPQGLGAWETITKGMVPGITTSSQPSLGGPAGAQAERRGLRGSVGWGFIPGFQAAPVQSGVGGGLSSTSAALPALPVAATPATVTPASVPSGLPDVRGAHPQLAYALQAAQQMFPGLTLTAGESDHKKDGGWHPKGQAIDIGGGTAEQQAQLSNWLLQYAPDIEELIHSGPGVTQNVKSGKVGPAIDMPGSVYNSGQAGYHGDHVHLAITDQMAQAFEQALGGQGSSALTQGPVGTSTDPYYMQYPDGYKPPGPDIGQFGQQMGSDIWGSILPDGFKNPTQFGSMKFLTGFLGGILGGNFGGSGGGSGKGMPASYWANGGTDMGGGGGGGGGGLGGLLSGILPQPFGSLVSGSPGNAPGQFMPAMPTAADAAISPFGVTGQGGVAGAGNQVVNAPININNPVGQDHLTNMVNTATQAQVPRVRQGIRPLP